MKLSGTLAVLALVLALAAGSTTYLLAQSTPSPSPSYPMPMMSGGMGQGQMQMMQPKSAADQELMAAMMQMHHSMMGYTMTGDPDRDFMVMMIPHHQAAVQMARTELRYGKNARLRQMAQTMLTTQQNEINQMNALLRAYQ